MNTFYILAMRCHGCFRNVRVNIYILQKSQFLIWLSDNWPADRTNRTISIPIWSRQHNEIDLDLKTSRHFTKNCLLIKLKCESNARLQQTNKEILSTISVDLIHAHTLQHISDSNLNSLRMCRRCLHHSAFVFFVYFFSWLIRVNFSPIFGCVARQRSER